MLDFFRFPQSGFSTVPAEGLIFPVSPCILLGLKGLAELWIGWKYF